MLIMSTVKQLLLLGTGCMAALDAERYLASKE
jgi:thioredoxin reductase